MIKIEPVPGAEKDSYRSNKPVMACDGCKTSKVDGNPGSGDHETMKAKAYDLGWRKDTQTSKDYCPNCVPPTSPPTGTTPPTTTPEQPAQPEQPAAPVLKCAP